jgi:hypothetical protein
MKKELCRFASVCKGYRKEAFTCAHEEEAKDYCGYYRRFKAAIKEQ